MQSPRPAPKGLSIPIVYNTSGYEREEAVAELGDLVDIWLVDYKYADASLGRALSHVPDYPEVASRALKRMCAEVARRGESSFVRMASWSAASSSAISCFPGSAADSCAVLDRVWEIAGDVPISVMNQYTPNERMRASEGDLARAVSASEYELVLDHADELGFSTMFWQEGGAVDESFTRRSIPPACFAPPTPSMPPIQLAADNAALGFRARFRGHQPRPLLEIISHAERVYCLPSACMCVLEGALIWPIHI